MRGREKKTFLLLVQNPTFSRTRTQALPKLSGEYHLGTRLPVARCSGIIFCYGQILFPFQVYLFINHPHPTLKSKMIVPISEGPGSQHLLGHGSTIFSFFDVRATQNLIGLSGDFRSNSVIKTSLSSITKMLQELCVTIYVFQSFRPSHRKRTSGYIGFVLS